MTGRRDDVDDLLEQLAALCCSRSGAFVAPLGMRLERGDEAGERRRSRESGVESRGAGLRLERTRRLVRRGGEGSRRGDAQALRVTHVQPAGLLGPAQPLLRRDGVEVEGARIDLDRAGGLRAVDEQRHPALAQAVQVEPAPRRPEDVRGGDEPRARRHRSEDRVLVRLAYDDARAGCVHRANEPEVLLVGRDDLVRQA